MAGRISARVTHGAATIREVADVARSVVRERRRHQPSPPPQGQGLVLDVGGGQAPCPRADIVVDKYIADDFERTEGSPLDISRPLVIADAEALPFGDDTFAYVVASHVLEHATDPALFAGELSRVGKAGYVQVPSREAELTFGWPFHPWLIDLDDDVLVFNGRGDAKAPIGAVFHAAAAESKAFGLWFAETRSTWHHSVDWEGELRVRLGDGEPDATTAQFDIDETTRRIQELLPRGLRGPDSRLRNVLRCPADRSALSSAGRKDASLECSACERVYPVVGSVPLLLVEAAL